MFEEVKQGTIVQGVVDQSQIVDLDELVGLLSYVVEGAALAPDRPIPWGGVSKLVKDINNRTSQLRRSFVESPVIHSSEFKGKELLVNQPLKSDPVRTAPPRSAAPTKEAIITEEADETEVDTGLKSSALARRIQMAPRPAAGHGPAVGSAPPPQGRVREIPLNEPR